MEIALGLSYSAEKRNAKKKIQTVSDIHDLLYLMEIWLIDKGELDFFASECFEEMLRDKQSVFIAEAEKNHQKRATLFALCCDFSEDKDLHVRVGKRLSVLFYYDQMEEQLSQNPRALASICSQTSKVMKVLVRDDKKNARLICRVCDHDCSHSRKIFDLAYGTQPQ